MKVGDKLVCIKNYIDNDSDFSVEFKKNKVYSIIEMNDDHVEIKGDVTYHNSPNAIYLSHGFSINMVFSMNSHKDGWIEGYKYLYRYFVDIKKYRKLKLKKINGIS